MIFFFPAEENEILLFSSITSICFSLLALLKPWTSTYMTCTIPLHCWFFTSLCSLLQKSYLCVVNVRAVFHFYWHKCHKPAAQRQMGLCILIILMWVIICMWQHGMIINLPVYVIKILKYPKLIQPLSVKTCKCYITSFFWPLALQHIYMIYYTVCVT